MRCRFIIIISFYLIESITYYGISNFVDIFPNFFFSSKKIFCGLIKSEIIFRTVFC